MEMTPTVQFIIGVYSSFLVSSYVGFDSTRACPVKCTTFGRPRATMYSLHTLVAGPRWSSHRNEAGDNMNYQMLQMLQIGGSFYSHVK